MRVIYVTEFRFFQTPDGKVWTPNLHRYDWWSRLLDVFSDVLVVARVDFVESVPGDFSRADGYGVKFYKLPYYIGPLGWVANYRKIISEINKINFFGSAVILSMPGIISYLVYRSLNGYPYSVYVIGDPNMVFSRGVSKHPLRPIIRYLFTRHQKTVCHNASVISYVTKNDLQKRYPTQKKNKNFRFSDVDLNINDYANKGKKYVKSKKIKLVFVGMFFELYKNQLNLIGALKILKKFDLDFELSMIGDGRYLNICKKMAQKLSLENVSFLGALPKWKMIDQMRKSDIFILPSRAEGLPRAIIQAMAQGIVCLATNVGGISDILNPEQLIKTGSPIDIANKIIDLSMNPKEMTRIASRNLKLSKQFSESNQQKKRVEFYNQIRKVSELYRSKSFITSSPEISVIMSAYNSAKYIKEAVESILKQSYKNFEFIIFDDCSTDGTKKLLKDFARQDNRIKLICRSKNLGQVSFIRNLNDGLKIARGKYIARMDADDVSHAKRFEKQINFFEKKPATFLLATSAIVIDVNGKVVSKIKTSSNKLTKKLTLRNQLVHSSIMFVNDKKIRYREKILYGQDYDFYLRLLTENKRIDCLSSALIKFRVYPDSESQNLKREKQILFSEKSLEFYRQRTIFGKDEYSKFDPGEISKVDIGRANSQILLDYRIKRLIKTGEIANIDKLFEKYFAIYGRNLQIMILFLISRSSATVSFSRKVSKIFKLSSW